MKAVYVHDMISGGANSLKNFSFGGEEAGWIEVLDSIAHLKSSLVKFIEKAPDDRKVRLREFARNPVAKYSVFSRRSVPVREKRDAIPSWLDRIVGGSQPTFSIRSTGNISGSISYDEAYQREVASKFDLKTVRDLCVLQTSSNCTARPRARPTRLIRLGSWELQELLYLQC